MIIRKAEIDDAENLLNLTRKVERESAYMLMEPEERQTTPDQQEKFIKQLEEQHNSTIFVAEADGKLIGYLIAMGGRAKRTQHTAYIVVGILQDYRGMGIGTKLFNHVIEWAPKCNLTRLELTAVTENKPGLALYRKSGFEIEGTKKQSLMIDGKPFDEYYMAKLL